MNLGDNFVAVKRQKIEHSEESMKEQEEKQQQQQLYNCNGLTTVYFDQNFPGRDIKLFELPLELLHKVKVGEHLKLVGGEKGEAVLCSQSTTFTIKKVETSNSVFIVSPSLSSSLSSSNGKSIYSITNKAHHYFELLPSRGKIDQIVDLLSATEYRGETFESLFPEITYTKSQLEYLIPASNEEIENALAKLHVVEVGDDKKLKILAKDILYETTRLVLDTIIENGWPLHSIDENAIKNMLPTVDHIFLNHVLDLLGEKQSSNTNIWKLSEDIVGRSTADMLFRFRSDTSKLWPVEDFLITWSSRTPGNNTPPESLLAGIAIKENITRGNHTISHYRHLPAEDLPIEIKARFGQLFAKRGHYNTQELEPYLSGYYGGVGQPKSLPELALQYARLVNNVYHSK